LRAGGAQGGQRMPALPALTPASVSTDLCEQFGCRALEEGFVEAAHGVGGVALLDDEGQVDRGRALRDQEHVDVLDGREDARGDAGRAAESLADDADDGAV